MKRRLIYTKEWGDQLQAGHDEYMDRLYGSVDQEEWDSDAGTDITGEPFCGCDTCERRASWSWLLIAAIEAYGDGSLKLEVTEDVPGG